MKLELQGEVIAEKRFTGGGLAGLVHLLLSGAPNPYRYDAAAAAAAYHRRQILALLLPYWFGERLTVAAAQYVRWDEEAEAFCLGCQYVEGQPAAIAAPFNRRDPGEVKELCRLMKALQGFLRSFGFLGALWQAGYGNPVALNNFLRRGKGWVMIDLESGVPALFPINPWKFFSFYLFHALRRGRPLFDDVEVARLKEAVEEEGPKLAGFLGNESMEKLTRSIAGLEACQQVLWRRTRRRRQVDYALSRNRVSAAKRARLLASGSAWLAWMIVYYSRLAVGKIGKLGTKFRFYLGRLLRTVFLLRNLRRLLLFFFSMRYRHKLGLNYVRRRLAAWRQRGQLTRRDLRTLDYALRRGQASDYLTDFAFLTGLKPLVKAAEVVLAVLFLDQASSGLVSYNLIALWRDRGVEFALRILLILMLGSIVRLVYTVGVSIYRRDLPLVALLVGLVPSLGNIAHPMQMLLAGGRGQVVASFIIFDFFSQAGIHFPVWGGADTKTEHAAIWLCRLVTFTAPSGVRKKLAPASP